MNAPLDPEFQPLIQRHRAHQRTGTAKLVIGLEREHGNLSRYETVYDPARPDARRYVERLVKFLLWARGGWRLYLEGVTAVAVREFDADLLARAYGRPLEIVTGPVPPARETGHAVGGHLDGCRLGFDLGASDYKVAAVRDGEVVFSAEFPWNPKVEPDPDYHYRHLHEGLRQAAAHLPRVDAIGGSTAGVVVDNQIRVASLFRAVPASRYAAAQNLFGRLRDEWRVPVEVANDGDVTALAGALALKVNGVLGIAMGSSEAAGYLDGHGRITGWLNELAFAPVDFNPAALADEWSGDCGVGALYFSQQAVHKLLPAAGIDLPAELGLPERLKAVQKLADQNDPRAVRIYETLGVYLGFTVPWYAEFYEYRHLLVLGRVTTGRGGDTLIARARAVLEREFPDLAQRIAVHVPDESRRRVGQAIAAASLPVIR
jgi:predicted NBD/HSP70 family sugar kinase